MGLILDIARDSFFAKFDPPSSAVESRKEEDKRTAEAAYFPAETPKGFGWCMAMGRFIKRSEMKASHVYQRHWGMQTAVGALSHANESCRMQCDDGMLLACSIELSEWGPRGCLCSPCGRAPCY